MSQAARKTQPQEERKFHPDGERNIGASPGVSPPPGPSDGDPMLAIGRAGRRKEAGAEVLALSRTAVKDRLAAAMRAAVANSNAPAKALARLADVNAATAKNWLAGKHPPGAVNLLTMLARVPELRAEVRRLTAMEAGIDPEFERDLSAVIAAASRLRGR